jgi:hypothetical protein
LAIYPPIIAPTKKTKFQDCVFQSKSKNFTRFPAPAIVQSVRKFEENPKDFPKKSIKNMTVEMMIPENHHGQGCIKKSSMGLGLGV